jgi:uncharacterized LabA/DUF88 family protein
MEDPSPAAKHNLKGQIDETPTSVHYTSVFIDIENFFGARNRSYENNGKVYRVDDLAEDLNILNQWVHITFQKTLFTVIRGYANFSRRFELLDPITGKKERRAWLQYAGDRLMKLGIEPVAIPALTSEKNTVDMRIAMDAGCCAVSSASAKRVILVAGDADYVPVILQLRSLGVEVLVVGFRPDTDQAPIWKYVRNFASEFCWFEDLLDEHTAKVSKTVKEEQEKNVPHSVFYYETVLEGSEPRFVLVPREDWIAITDAIYRTVNRGVTTLDDLEARVLQELGADPTDASGSLTAVMKQLWDSGCFRLLENGSQLPDRGGRQIGFAPDMGLGAK